MIHRNAIRYLAAILLAAGADAATITVTNTNDSGAGSLRQAVLDSNASGGVLDTVTFNIPGSGVQTITLASALPNIVDAVVIDGYTQPGASPNTLLAGDDAVILVELRGGGSATNGFVITGSNSTVRGLVITNFVNGRGVDIPGPGGGNHVEGCFIGIDPTGTLERHNGGGIVLTSSNNVVGGSTVAARNIISGNRPSFIQGIWVIGGSGNVIKGNFIGTDRSGTSNFAQQAEGIDIANATPNTIIGGPNPAERNIISGGTTGIVLRSTASGCTVQGNYIGTDVTGMRALENTILGIDVVTDGNTIGGAAPGAGNLISGNRSNGIQLDGGNNVVAGNFIGTNATGTSAIPNGGSAGLVIGGTNAKQNNLIGGAAPNVISGNTRSGIYVNSSSINNMVKGNFIGTQADGRSPLGNKMDGIQINSAGSLTIGGTNPGDGNIIAFNDRSGVVVERNLVIPIEGNLIYGNGALGIVNGTNFTTPTTNQPGAVRNYPVLTNIISDGTNTTIAGTYNGLANTTFRLEFFSSSVRDKTGYGQGENFIGATSLTTDGAGNASFNVTVPQAADGQWFTATAIDSAGNTSEFSQAIATSSLAIVDATVVTARTGQPFKFRVLTGGGNPTQRLSVTGLPPGLSANTVTGRISGTPATDGSYHVLITVTDGAIVTNSTLDIVVVSDPGLPVIVSPSVAAVPSGQAFTYKIDAPANTAPTDITTFSIFGPLPAGLSFNPATGVISGTSPTIAKQRVYGVDRVELSGGTLLSVIQLFAANSHGQVTTPLALLQLPPMAVNISTRLPVGTNENVLIGGFIITGNAPKIVILRAIGPSLNAVLQGVLQDPQLELRDGAGQSLAINDDWRTNQEAEINETGVPPTNEHEAAIVALLEPGNYTAVLRGAGISTGIGVVEAYDLGTATMDVGSGSQLANISTRGFVKTNDNAMIGGLIAANGSATFMIRAIGPSLSRSGLQGALPDPTLELRSGDGAILASNDNWKTRPDGSSQQAEIEATTIPPTDNLESALVQTVKPGNYTAIVRDKNNKTGVGLVEVYNLTK